MPPPRPGLRSNAVSVAVGGFSFEPCSSGDTFTGLGTGSHTFQVEAVDTTASKNASAPASSTPWTIVDANISLSPATATNEVGTTSHTVTCTIKQDIGDGNGFVAGSE